MQICMEPIGYVANDVNSQMDSGWARVESKIVLQEHLILALSGLDSFSHLLVVFWMHQAEPPTILQRRPQGRDDMPEVGLFAQRSKHRPNPIGITAVPLVRVSGCEVVVRGLDAVNGTPVLDIKPYYPHFDSPAEVRLPAWVDRLMVDYF
ncbi:MAG: tRNA (N6-threonylcarbamoyladenosine(37)-N6)-methyltransferase TrmO [Dehalococcoidales bacterium]|nr:tRNA (N6-threonylcarbamoyladenosine(37)-N6)-methyltransferase TrmO [Dehalococcoidales bacterium]